MYRKTKMMNSSFLGHDTLVKRQEDFKALQEAVKDNSVGFRKSADGISEFVDL